MRKINWEKFKKSTLSTVRAFPVEILLSLCLFIVVVLKEETHQWQVDHVDSALAYIPLFWILSFSLNQFYFNGWKRGFYFLSILFVTVAPFIPFKVDDLSYFVVWVIAMAVLFACRTQKDNFRFTIDTLRIPYHIAIAVMLTLALSFLLWSIYSSLIYIFDLDMLRSKNVVFYLFLFPLTVIAPFFFCLFENVEKEQYDWQPIKVLDILGNWILSPALIVYTVLLYIYGIKILFTWNLPKGMLSYMISIYLFIAVVARACQFLLGKRSFERFYKNLNLTVIPVLILMWVGILYRIVEYGFTEERVYLLILGVLISVVSVISFTAPRQKYLYFLYLVIVLLVPVTFIPGIQAKKLGIISQEYRLGRVIQALDLQDPASGLIRNSTIPESLRDSLSVELYHRLAEGFTYLQKVTPKGYMKEKYGYASVNEMEKALFGDHIPEYLRTQDNHVTINHFSDVGRTVSIAGYRELIEYNNSPILRGDSVFLEDSTKLITAFDVKNFFTERPELLSASGGENRNDLLYLENDSCYAVIEHLSIRCNKIQHLSVRYVLIK
ncbi:MAG: DUF4153 domain-containing protein [Massilibacteroides sp.]|nr:DUF4153 domain-containing protein [Massilibacteroides sp.]MDD4115857.1 DUF4153 domain-containing protein [Massilibacteroides sp.]MDD4661564.1 DUF4153 domain-containing protein [Massilibacteroides sp.]